MNIALIGSSGREHALCQKIHESRLAKKIICIPGNAGTKNIAKNIDYYCFSFGNFDKSNMPKYENIPYLCDELKIKKNLINPVYIS